MKNQTTIRGVKYATDAEGDGLYLLRGGAYQQVRGNGQSGKPIKNRAQMLRRIRKYNAPMVCPE